MHARPVGQRRTGENDRPEQLGTERCQHHDRPAGLAIADHAGLAVGLGMKLDDLLEEDRFGARNVLDRLARHRIGKKADEIAGMAGFEGDADLAVRLEAANPGPCPARGSTTTNGRSTGIDRHALGRNDARQDIVDGPLEGAAVDHKFGVVIEDMRSVLGQMLAILIAALPQHIPEQDAPLASIDQIFNGRSEHAWHRH